MKNKNFFSSSGNKSWRFPAEKTAQHSLSSLSFTEKFIFQGLVSAVIISSLLLVLQVSQAYTVEVPQKGGTLNEGIVGSPRFINPLFAETDADRDLTFLVYSGLLKATPDGGLINDLSESYEISEDGTIYTFKLKDNIFFHDGTKVTAEDVEFTVVKTQDPTLRSPRRINWEGVDVEVINEREIRFALSEPFAPFLENATLGILPKHLWENLEPEQFTASLLNVEPIGSGPYKIRKIKRGSDGLPIYYNLRAFSKYSLGTPYIKNLYIRMFPNENSLVEALERGRVESAGGISPNQVERLRDLKGLKIKSITLPRIFGVFFNQNQASVFTNKEVRRALNIALDREVFVEEILSGFGSPIESTLPVIYSDSENDLEGKIQEAEEILEENGWTRDDETGIRRKGEEMLSFSISTHDTDDLKLAGQILKEQWERIGAEVEIKIFDRSDFTQNVIRPRRYDALLFGKVIGRDLDLFPFWHSSSRNDPGLNISLYANIKTDRLLEEARTLIDKEERLNLYREFEEIIKEDVPASFIYSPDFLYLVPEKIKNLKLGHITTSDDRFLNVHQWYIETNNVWEIFIN